MGSGDVNQKVTAALPSSLPADEDEAYSPWESTATFVQKDVSRPGTTSAVNELLEQALSGATRERKREAFVALISGEHWKLVLAPHVVSQQSFKLRERDFADTLTFQEAAPRIAASEDKIQRALELLGCKHSQELVEALAQQMGAALVEHALAHLRTADGDRAVLLQHVLQQADPGWVKVGAAKRVIRRQLASVDLHRSQLLTWLAESGNLKSFTKELLAYPPVLMEDWNALGIGRLQEPSLTQRALAELGQDSSPLPYLLRLEPLPEELGPRMMAAARTDWLVNALETAIITNLTSPLLVPLVELGVRLGGRCMSTAVAWLNTAQLGQELLRLLANQLLRERGRTRISDLLWVQRHSHSASRALEHGRSNQVPEPLDAAALARHTRGDKAVELVQEILVKPRPAMAGLPLKLLCAVNPEAAREVMALGVSLDPAVAQRANAALAWTDVSWPEDQTAS